MPARDLVYMGRCERDLTKFPEDVKEEIAFALQLAMDGEKHPEAVPLRGFGGAGVLAIHDSHNKDTYRVVYTIDCPGVVCVLHAFKKKSTKGDATPKPDMDVIRERYGRARQLFG